MVLARLLIYSLYTGNSNGRALIPNHQTFKEDIEMKNNYLHFKTVPAALSVVALATGLMLGSAQHAVAQQTPASATVAPTIAQQTQHKTGSASNVNMN